MTYDGFAKLVHQDAGACRSLVQTNRPRHVSLGAGRYSVPRVLRPGIDNVPEIEDATLNPPNADTDRTENLVCARHLLDIHLELAHVLSVDFSMDLSQGFQGEARQGK
jgi:hypothetical protein